MMNRTISFVSFNMYGGFCKEFEQSPYHMPFCDFLFTQEDDSKHSFLLPFKKECGTGSEKVGAYSLEQVESECIITESELEGIPNRHAILIRYDKLIIANLHMEGGRFSDKKLLVLKQSLLNYKLSLLERVLDKEPHIILGDFNSVYCTEPERFELWMSRQFQYFESIYDRVLMEEELQLIRDWNTKPYDLLKEKGYTYAKPSNEERHMTNGRGSTIIDCIWYKGVQCKETFILPSIEPSDIYALNQCISDHNPIFAQFEFEKAKNPPKLPKSKKIFTINEIISSLLPKLDEMKQLERDIKEKFRDYEIVEEFDILVSQELIRVQPILEQFQFDCQTIQGIESKQIVWPTEEKVIRSLKDHLPLGYVEAVQNMIYAYKADQYYYKEYAFRVLNELQYKNGIPILASTLPKLGESVCYQTPYEITPVIQERFVHRPFVQAFHATDMKSLVAIIESGKMKCGQYGKFGSGIYFCPRPTDCIIKSLNPPEILLDVDLHLGRTKVLFGQERIGNRDTYDSIIFTKRRDNSTPILFTGNEFMVFRHQQVIIKRIYLLKSNVRLEKQELLKRFYPHSPSSNMNEKRYESFERIDRMIKGGWDFKQTSIYKLNEETLLKELDDFLFSKKEIIERPIELPNEIQDLLNQYTEEPVPKEMLFDTIRSIVNMRYEQIVKEQFDEFIYETVKDRSYACPIENCKYPFHNHLDEPATTKNLMGKKSKGKKSKTKKIQKRNTKRKY